MKRRKLRNTRPKALFGEGVAAAAITAAATMAAAGIGAAATSRAAREQSQATIQNAKQQADALAQTNQNNNMLQQQSQQFIAQENEANRQIQRDLQLSLQMQGGQLDSEQRRAASRIQVKKGGKVSRKKLRDAFFYGGGNLPFQVIDGGGVLPIGQTPEGYDLYEIIGNDHNHYHKTKGGKYKSGVGIKFADGQVVEGEGNQNSRQGEYLMVTPDSGMFISKHSNNGFNPAEAVMEGMHPLVAYNIQENLKTTSPVKRNRHKALAGVSTNYILPTDYPMDDVGFTMSGVNVAAARRNLKKGGRCKAPWGLGIQTGFGKRVLPYLPSAFTTNPQASNTQGITPMSTAYELNGGGSRSNGSFYNKLRNISGNLWGAGIGALGNLGGAWLTSWGANRASKYLSKGYTEAANIMADAYDRLTGVDMSSINRDMFRNQHFMPVVRSSYYNANPQIEDTKREFRRLMRATNAGTLSTAARLSRMSGANAATNEQLSRIYADKANREEATKQNTLQQLNEAAARNAELDVQSSKDFTGHYIDLLKYNNDIANSRITGRAQALAEGVMGSANAIAAARQAAGQSWGNAVFNTGKGFGDALAVDAAQQNELNVARMQATRAGELSYLKRLGSPEERDAEVNRLYSIITNPSSTESQRTEAQRDLNYLTSNSYENTSLYNNLMGNYGLRGSINRVRSRIRGGR